jgi:hypothetical protein
VVGVNTGKLKFWERNVGIRREGDKCQKFIREMGYENSDPLWI